MRNLKPSLMFLLVSCIFASGVLGCERNKKPLANIEPEGDSPEYKFEPHKNVPPEGAEKP